MIDTIEKPEPRKKLPPISELNPKWRVEYERIRDLLKDNYGWSEDVLEYYALTYAHSMMKRDAAYTHEQGSLF